MKIVHFSDVHIGVENFSRIDPDTGLPSRLIDFLGTLDEVIDYCINNSVDLAIFAGDAYKNRNPSQTHQREFAKRIQRLSTAKIPIVLVEGNHDIPSVFGRATALDIFKTLNVSNVILGNKADLHRIKTKSGFIQVITIPWVRRSNLLTREETKGLSLESINVLIQDKLSSIISDLASQLDTSLPAILASHITISGSTTSSEQSMMLGKDYVLLTSSISLPIFDYVALGHIHKRQTINEHNPTINYSGSLERIDFGEENDDKGFYSIEINENATMTNRLKKAEFIKVNARKLLTIKVNVETESLDPTEQVLNEISKHDLVDAVVKLTISMPNSYEGKLIDSRIRDALKPAHYLAGISVIVKGSERVRLGAEYNSSISPMDTLKMYLKIKKTPKKQSSLLIDKALEIIENSGTTNNARNS
ncbi:MAG: exonuclease SbcCD subunit D [SAR202 cluster bacterium]|nr:exonuclease SbcCD subunit D [SAR202 cluster bacterium]|tara:strand:+ start:19940 stop:21196 length:1257 start_codon:yes stop_codon:yes gene_type:complete